MSEGKTTINIQATTKLRIHCDIDCDGSGFKWIFSMDRDFQRNLGQRVGKIFTLTHKDNTCIAFCTSLLMIQERYLRIQVQSNTPVQSVQDQSQKTIELCFVMAVVNGAILGLDVEKLSQTSTKF